jgi:uncharacterized NAD(P)/FAD-binding protein YdhS
VPLWEHLAVEPPAFVAQHGPPRDLRSLVRFVRRDARERLARGEPWHGAIDDVRDAAGAIWNALGDDDRARFVRHVKPWYDSHRFRIPPQTAELLAEAERAGRLSFEAGRVEHAEATQDGLAVRVRPRGGATSCTRRFAAVLSCAGVGGPVARTRHPSLRACLVRGLVRPGVAGRGLDADAESRAVGADGEPDPSLTVLGSSALDRFGETPAAIFVLRQVLRLMPRFVAAL